MLFFARLVIVGQIQKFGAIQADALSAAVARHHRYRRGIRYSPAGRSTWPSCVSLGSSCSQRQVRLRCELLAAFGFAMLGELLGIRVDDDHAAGAVDDDGVAAADLGGDIAQARRLPGCPSHGRRSRCDLCALRRRWQSRARALRSRAAVWLAEADRGRSPPHPDSDAADPADAGRQSAEQPALEVVNVFHPLREIGLDICRKRFAWRRITTLTAYSAVV